MQFCQNLPCHPHQKNTVSSKTLVPKCLQPGAVTTRRTWHLFFPRVRTPCRRSAHYSEDFASAKGAVQQANDRFWQVDDLQPSTAPPSSFAYNPNTVLDLDMTDFRVKEKGFFSTSADAVCGVPRSSLKGKETQHDEREKNTSNPKTKQKPTKQKPKPKNENTTKGQRPVLPRLKVFPLYESETIEKGRT